MRAAGWNFGLKLGESTDLLAGVCIDAIDFKDGVGYTCTLRPLGPEFADLGDSFHPEMVIYGRFLNSTSDDAVVSGWSMKSHPTLGGGTLLLTRREGRWQPVWYRSAVITKSCRKLTLPSGREILLCETGDGGMGHVFHFIYTVDLTAPADVRSKPLVVADSFRSSCVEREQEIAAVKWYAESSRLAVTIRTPQWRQSPNEVCVGDPAPAERPRLVVTLEFELDDLGFRPIPLPALAEPRR